MQNLASRGGAPDVVNPKSRKLWSEGLGSGRLNNIAIPKDKDRRWESIACQDGA